MTYYPEGAGINWHKYAGAFAERVVGVSVGAPCRMELRRGEGGERRVFEQELAPRSAYVLSGTARFVWQHHIPPIRADRYSITFRALRAARGRKAARGSRAEQS